jgi:hypothetical protein
MTTSGAPIVSDSRLEVIEYWYANLAPACSQEYVGDLLREVKRLRSPISVEEREALLAGADACGFMANGSPMAEKWRTWDASLRKLAERK